MTDTLAPEFGRLVAAVRRAIRTEQLFREPLPPPPADIDAEQDVLHAVLCAAVPLEALDLDADCFVSDLMRSMYEAIAALAPAGEQYDLATVRDAMRARGVRGPIEEELVQIVATTPFVLPAIVRVRADRLRELCRRRRLLAVIGQVDAELRADVLDARAAVKRIVETMR